MDTGNGNGTAVASGLESAVQQRYAEASRKTEACLCVPSNAYDRQYLRVLPPEIIERDYGCGDPSKWVRESEVVLDLGSGSGKICYICAQKVGPAGKVIGVDFNEPMLELARKHRQLIGDSLGYHNVEFRKGKIQDLRLDLEQFEQYLGREPATDADSYLLAQEEAERLRRSSPMIPDNSIDVIVSNCVLNLVNPNEKRQLFEEMFRALKAGGRCVISDIVSDEEMPEALQREPELWSGCISGAFREDLLLKAFEDAGFYGMSILERSDQPWQTIKGIEFRSTTVQAFKGKQGPCFERNQAVVYKGPWRKVIDDDGHMLERGQRMAVCDKTFRLYQREPYREQFFFVDPLQPIPSAQARPFDCRANARRDPRETKGVDYDKTTESSRCCGPDGCC
jgi:ubiquinone/menaquinone biosynthesis C-methylase UbiE